MATDTVTVNSARKVESGRVRRSLGAYYYDKAAYERSNNNLKSAIVISSLASMHSPPRLKGAIDSMIDEQTSRAYLRESASGPASFAAPEPSKDSVLFEAKYFKARGEAAKEYGLDLIAGSLLMRAAEKFKELGGTHLPKELKERAELLYNSISADADGKEEIALIQECRLCAIEELLGKNKDQFERLNGVADKLASYISYKVPSLNDDVFKKIVDNSNASAEKQAVSQVDLKDAAEEELKKIVESVAAETSKLQLRKEEAGEAMFFDEVKGVYSCVTSRKNIAQLYDMYTKGMLDLSPKYQRGKVWMLADKQELIDTIFRGLMIPEIFLRVLKEEGKAPRYEIMDGKQRLTAIFEFMAQDGYRVHMADNSTVRFNAMDKDSLHLFLRYKLTTKEIDAPEHIIRLIFERLNKNGVPLNKQEIRHAIYTGKFASLVEELSKEKFLNQSKIVGRSMRRMADVAYVAELLIGIVSGPQDGAASIDDFYAKYDKSFPMLNQAKERFIRTEGAIKLIFPDLGSYIQSWAKRADFYALFLAMANLTDKYSLSPSAAVNLKSKLVKFRSNVLTEREASADPLVREYIQTIMGGTTNMTNRKRRIEIIEGLVKPFMTGKD